MLFSKKILTTFAFIASFGLLLTGCGTDSGGSGMGSMTVEMTDAPIDSADAVNVFIERVEVNNTEDEEEGWETLSEPQQEYNLLDLTNGATEVIGAGDLEAGTYPQIRLVLSREGHSVEVDGEVHDMFVPSGAQTGIKLNIDAEIEEDIDYVLLLDFDASRSVVEAGANEQNPYILKPVIKAKEKAITGNIEGVVEPADAEPVVYAIADEDTLASTIADTDNGEFRLIGLEEGSYDVSVDPRNEDYESTTVEGVEVEVEETTDIETIELSGN